MGKLAACADCGPVRGRTYRSAASRTATGEGHIVSARNVCTLHTQAVDRTALMLSKMFRIFNAIWIENYKKKTKFQNTIVVVYELTLCSTIFSLNLSSSSLALACSFLRASSNALADKYITPAAPCSRQHTHKHTIIRVSRRHVGAMSAGCVLVIGKPADAVLRCMPHCQHKVVVTATVADTAFFSMSVLRWTLRGGPKEATVIRGYNSVTS